MKKQITFTDNGISQDFDFPTPIISYICKNPLPLPDFIYKIYSTCKYFYPKIKIIPCEKMDILHFMPMADIIWPMRKKISLPKAEIYSLNFKLLGVKTIFHITVKRETDDSKLIPFLFEKVFLYCSDCRIVISGQIFTLKEYENLAAISLSLRMHDVGITNLDKTVVPVEELLSIGKNITNFTFRPADDNINYYTPETAQIMAKTIRPKKFCSFELQKLPANFNAMAFSTFVKNNADHSSKSYINLKFHESVEEEVLVEFCDIINTEFCTDERYEKISFKVGY